MMTAPCVGRPDAATQSSEFVPAALFAHSLGSADKGFRSLDLISTLPGFTKTFGAQVSSLRRLFLVSFCLQTLGLHSL